MVSDSDNPQVKGIMVALPKNEGDKYGLLNPQETKSMISILLGPICH